MLGLWSKRTLLNLSKKSQLVRSAANFSTQNKNPNQQDNERKEAKQQKQHDKHNKSHKSSVLHSDTTLKSLQSKWKFELEDGELKQQPTNTTSQASKSASAEQKVGADNVAISAARYRFQKQSDPKKKKLALEKLRDSQLEPYNFSAVHKEHQQLNPIVAYQNKKVVEIIDNAKKSKETIQEVISGEEGVDRIDYPNDPTYQFYHDDNDVFMKIKNSLLGFGAETLKKEDYNEWRKTILRKREYEDLKEEEVKLYPGSSKGPRAEDDPDFFADWLVRNMPARLKEMYAEADPAEFGISVDNDEADDDIAEVTHPSILYHDIQQQEIPFTAPESTLISSQMLVNMHSQLDKGELPPLPQHWDKPWQEYLLEMEKYTIFRMMPRLDAWFAMFHNFSKNMTGEENVALIIRPLPSLYAYYNLLPDFARANPAVKNLYRKLETTKHTVSLETKQIALNYAAQFTLPLDPYLDKAIACLVENRKARNTLAEDLSLLALDSDEERFELETTQGKKVELDKIDNAMDPAQSITRMQVVESIEHQDIEWPRPPGINAHEPEETPSDIPVDFYDNEDGFWDRYISWKEAGYDQYPIIKGRQNFKH